MKRRQFLLTGAALVPAWGFRFARADDALPTPEWDRLRATMFGTRPLATEGDAVPLLEVPARAADAATVPVALQSPFNQSAARYVKTMYLVIDRNPTPLAAVFRFTPQSGRAELATRVRVEQYTFMRVIAELNDGSLHLTSRFVKAAGGCSAPAGKDPAAAAANLGQMKLRVDQESASSGPRRARLMVRHPNTSGLAMDQLTRLYAKPHFVRELTVRYRGEPVLEADLTFAISENPDFGFRFLPGDGGELEARVVDTENLNFTSRVTVPGPAAS
jgi:sulfur-oxidizing protein SoxY